MNRELSLKEVHGYTLTLIQKLDELCRQLDVKYVVWYGSLLGAIRHKGFIPWDDDFDVIMPRPDYEKFAAYCRTHEKELGSYRLIDKNTRSDYPYNIARFSDTSYHMILDGYSDAGMGLFLDVYPFDGIGDDPEQARKKILWRKKLYAIGWNSAIRQQAVETRKGLKEQLVKRLIYLWAKHKSPHYFYRLYDKLADLYSYEGSSYVTEVVWDMDFVPIKKEWLDDLIRVPFENITVPVPRAYDTVLTLLYGDYMTPPPVEQQVPTHSYRLYIEE